MKLEDQVVSLELAKKLREVGLKQESLFYWDDDAVLASWCWNDVSEYEPNDWQILKEGFVSAFTVAELGEMLPWMVGKMPPFLYLQIKKDHHGWIVRYQFMDEEPIEEVADTEADARAQIMIYLLKSNLIPRRS